MGCKYTFNLTRKEAILKLKAVSPLRTEVAINVLNGIMAEGGVSKFIHGTEIDDIAGVSFDIAHRFIKKGGYFSAIELQEELDKED